MTRKTTGKTGSTGKGGRREGAPKQAAKRGPGKSGGAGPGGPDRGKKPARRPGWMPDPPPRGGMRPPVHRPSDGSDPFADGRLVSSSG